MPIPLYSIHPARSFQEGVRSAPCSLCNYFYNILWFQLYLVGIVNLVLNIAHSQVSANLHKEIKDSLVGYNCYFAHKLPPYAYTILRSIDRSRVQELEEFHNDSTAIITVALWIITIPLVLFPRWLCAFVIAHHFILCPCETVFVLFRRTEGNTHNQRKYYHNLLHTHSIHWW